MRPQSNLRAIALAYTLISCAGAVTFWNPVFTASETIAALQKRADSCPSSSPVSCSAIDSKLPNDFCCTSDTFCISLDSSSSALCCPKNDDGLCEKIQPIDCNVQLQNASSDTSPVYTTRLNDKLSTCNGKCCPFGYDCQNNICLLKKDTAIVNNSTSTTEPVTTIIATSTVLTTVTVPPTAAGIDSTSNQPASQCNKFPAGVFLAGFFPGVVLGILWTLAWVVLSGRHVKPGAHPRQSGPEMASGPGFKGEGARPYISHPIPLQRYSNERSDFLSRTRSRAKSLFSLNRPNNTRTVDSVDMWNKMPTPPADHNIPESFLGRMNDVPVTPARRVAQYSHHSTEDPSRPETMQVYSPDMFTNQTNAAGTYPPPLPPVAAVAPLRGMQGQRQQPQPSPSIISSIDDRRDSGVGSEDIKQGKMFPGFGSPFKTPERKVGAAPVQTTMNNAGLTTLNNVTYQNIKKLESPTDNIKAVSAANNSKANQQDLTILSPTRYQPEMQSKANSNTTSSNQPQARPRPPIPNTSHIARPATEIEDSSPEVDDGASFAFDNPPRQKGAQPNPGKTAELPKLETKHLAPNSASSSAYPPTSFAAILGPPSPAYLYDDETANSRDPSKKSKHDTNATTFTAMLRHAGFPDPLNEKTDKGKGKAPAVPKVPKGFQQKRS